MANKRSISCMLCLALIILLLPLQWLLSALAAAFIHELGHYCAVRLLGGSVQRLQFGTSGAIMEATGLTQRSELVCLLAGPLTGLLSVFAIRIFPTIALCGIVQSAYNLLPIYPLDGGKMLRIIILMAGGTEYSFQLIEHFVLLLLLTLCIYIKLRFGISLFLFFVILLLRKTPCKPPKDWI